MGVQMWRLVDMNASCLESLREGFLQLSQPHPSFNSSERFSSAHVMTPQLKSGGCTINIPCILLDRIQYPNDFSTSSTSDIVGMIGSARTYIGRTLHVRDVNDKTPPSRAAPRHGLVEFVNGEQQYFITEEKEISEGSKYRLQEALLDSCPPNQPVLRIESVEEVVG